MDSEDGKLTHQVATTVRIGIILHGDTSEKRDDGTDRTEVTNQMTATDGTMKITIETESPEETGNEEYKTNRTGTTTSQKTARPAGPLPTDGDSEKAEKEEKEIILGGNIKYNCLQ